MGPFPFQASTSVARPPIPAPWSTSKPVAVIPTLALCAPRRDPLQPLAALAGHHASTGAAQRYRGRRDPAAGTYFTRGNAMSDTAPDATTEAPAQEAPAMAPAARAEALAANARGKGKGRQATAYVALDPAEANRRARRRPAAEARKPVAHEPYEW
ncbi:hypothetical protein SEA_CHEETODUST_94 [Mycobacterium phage CheetoDust]|nr:hypothetical protein SEA_CHEETODUST_94 [Mycobacterium phage CheetoDust]